MGNKKVVLIRLCKTEAGWRRYPAVIGKNGRVKPNCVRVGEQEKCYPEGRYQLRTYEGAKMVYRDAGEHGGDALALRDVEARTKQVVAEARSVGLKVEVSSQRVELGAALDLFVTATENRGSLVAAKVYRCAAKHFLEASGVQYADEITPVHISRFHGAMRKQDLSARTIAQQHIAQMAWL